MQTTELRILVASALLLMTASAQALQPEVLYAFQLGPKYPVASLVQANGGDFYGTTVNGGSSGMGTVFQVTTNRVLTTLLSFTGTNGAETSAGLVLGSDGKFYGTTAGGGSNGYYGTIFTVTTNGVLTSLLSFTGANGARPEAELVLGSDGNFYGTTKFGGTDGYGTVFQVTSNGVFTSLISFTNGNGAFPEGQLVWGDDGNLYGTTESGGNGASSPWTGSGTVFRMTTNGVLTSLFSFSPPIGDARTNAHGARPFAGLVLGSDGHFYGTTHGGGSSGYGTVFKVTANGVLTSLASFTGDNGAHPLAGLVLGTDGNLYGTTYWGVGLNPDLHNGTVFRITTNGLLTMLVSFNGANGTGPLAELVLGGDGDFYGTTDRGGNNGYGTVFKITTNGTLTSLVSLTDPNGANPSAGLVQGSGSDFYGTTGGEFYSRNSGTLFNLTTNGVLTTLLSSNHTNGALPNELVLGSDGDLYGTTQGSRISDDEKAFGTVFQLRANGVLTTLVSFSGTNGAYPQAGLVSGLDGNLYGTTSGGGSDVWGLNRGNGGVFQVTTNGVLTTLVLFARTNGAGPQAGLVLDSDGNFYGTTARGGSSDLGTVFRVTTGGVLTSLVSFTGTNGANPFGGLVFDSDGNFYGTTSHGGTGICNDGSGSGCGTLFRMTPDGVLTTLASFNGANGAHPQAKLLLGRDGNFYGTTELGGNSYVIAGEFGNGTVFRATTNGVLTTLASFDYGNGARPRAGLVLGRDGYYYGTTSAGGPGGGGTVFRLVVSGFTSVATQSGGSMLLAGTGPINGEYRLWASTDLSLPLSSWDLLTSASFDNNGNLSYADAGAATNTSRFYHISVP